MTTNRKLYIDYLRVIAVIGVVILHVSGTCRVGNVKSVQWQVSNIVDSMVRWQVPVFVMISGALMLGRNLTIKRIIKCNVWKIYRVLLCWSIIYAVFIRINGATLMWSIRKAIIGPTHLWFLWMIMGLYIIVPFLDEIVKRDDLLKLFVVIAFISSFLMSDIVRLLPYVNEKIGELINEIYTTINFNFAVGYVGYFVTGYYLDKVEISKKYRIIIYILGILGLLTTIVGSSLSSLALNDSTEMFFENMGINIYFMSMAVFVSIKYSVKEGKESRTLTLLCKCSLGIYLVHELIIDELVKYIQYDCENMNIIVYLLIISVVTFLISFTISLILNKIPVIRKMVN